MPYWKINHNNFTLEHAQNSYCVDLDRCKTLANVLEWILQVSGKSWATESVVGSLVKEMDRHLDLWGMVQKERA